jgi:branched-chain amino acid transport system substrate-binding protein
MRHRGVVGEVPGGRGALLLLLLLPLACCGRGPAVRVGLLNPQTGSLRDSGTSCFEGARLAMEELNAGPGLLVGGVRRRVELVSADSGDTPESAVSAAMELINKRDVVAIIGPPFSSQAIPVARLAERASVPMITQFATNPEVTKGMSWVFRSCFTDKFQGDVMARFARAYLKAGRAAILFDELNAFTRDISAIFLSTYTAAGGLVVAVEPYTTGQKDFTAELRRIKRAAPDVLFLPGFAPDLRLQLPALRSLGITAVILGCDTMYFRDPADIGLCEDAYLSTHFSPDAPSDRVQEFSRRYKAAFKRAPTPGGALTYDAITLLARVISTEGSVDGVRIRDGLRAVGRFEGVTGPMIFNGSADPVKGAVIMHVKGGGYRFATTVTPVSAPE